MTTATLPISTPLSEPRINPAKGLLWRMYDAFIEARLRAAMRGIEMRRHLHPESILRTSARPENQHVSGYAPSLPTLAR